MAIKLKLKVPSSQSNTDDSKNEERYNTSVPKIKIKPPSSGGQQKESLVLSIGKKKIKVGKEKANKIKLSLKNRDSSDSLDLGNQPVKVIPKVRVKPTRIPGEGYDSEAPDLEDDPLLEQGIIIRFINDSKLDFVHNAVDSGDLTGINIKWVAKDKAVVNIKGTFYSARLVDLPTITELYKTVDKKNIFKTLDVWQMLLVLKEIIPSDLNIDKDFEMPSESLYTHPLYKMTPKNELKPSKFVYRDGLTSPYKDVFRRFRPRKVNHRVSNDLDARVNELIKLDNEAEESHFEIIDLTKETNKFGSLSGTPSTANSPQVFNTAFDREDVTSITNNDIIESDLEEELAKALANDEDIELEDGVEDEGEDQEQSMAMEEDVAGEEEEDEDEEDEDEDDDDEEDDEEEEEGKADKQHLKMLEEEIADLEKVVEVHRRGLASATHKMMKMKFQTSYNTLKSSLDAKKREFSKMVSEQQANDKMNSNLYTKPSTAQRDEDVEEEQEEEEEEEEDDEDEEEVDENNKEDHQQNDGQEDDIDDLF